MGIVPVNYATIVNAFSSYKSPKDKIARLEAAGALIRLKKGLYIASPKLTGELYSPELIANHLYGPSYVSLETAIAYYGLIPERVHLTRSMTTKRAKEFSTAVGNFTYTKTSADYFGIGLRQIKIGDQYAFMISTPEKALCDLICYTSGLRIQSAKAMRAYLEDDMRITLSEIDQWDLEIIKQAIQIGRKQHPLKLLLEVLDAQ